MSPPLHICRQHRKLSRINEACLSRPPVNADTVSEGLGEELSAAHPLPMAVPLWKPATTATVSTINVQFTAGM